MSMPCAAIEPTKLYTVKEVSDLLRHKSDWVRRHFGQLTGVIHCGEMRPGKRHYDTLLIPGDVLLKWIGSRSAPLSGNKSFTLRREPLRYRS